jgi:hypothetical protein
VAVGIPLFRARDWAMAFRWLAVMEVERRGLLARSRSLLDEDAILRMLGAEPVPSRSSYIGLRALAVLIGYRDARELAVHIAERRQTLLLQMLHRQARRVERVRTVKWASRLWVAQRSLSQIEVALRGSAWLLRRSLKEIVAVGKDPSAELGVVAVFAGSLYWLLVRKKNGSAAPDVLDVLNDLVVPGVILWSIGVLLLRMLVARFGRRQSWSTKIVKVIVAAGLISTGVTYLANLLGHGLAAFTGRVSLDHRVVALFAAVGIVFMAWASAKRVPDQSLRKSDRIGSLAVSLLFLAMSIPAASLVFSASARLPSPLRMATFAMLIAGCLVVLVSVVYSVGEWLDRSRTLALAGVEVPRRGFSVELLGAWVFSLLAVVVSTMIPVTVLNDRVWMILLPPALFAFLGAIPILIVTCFYVRRVNAYFEQHNTVGWADVGVLAPMNASNRCMQRPFHATVTYGHINPSGQ